MEFTHKWALETEKLKDVYCDKTEKMNVLILNTVKTFVFRSNSTEMKNLHT